MNVPVKVHLSPALARSTISERRMTSRLYVVKGRVSMRFSSWGDEVEPMLQESWWGDEAGEWQDREMTRKGRQRRDEYNFPSEEQGNRIEEGPTASRAAGRNRHPPSFRNPLLPLYPNATRFYDLATMHGKQLP